MSEFMSPELPALQLCSWCNKHSNVTLQVSECRALAGCNAAIQELSHNVPNALSILADKAMLDVFNAEYVSLHVRVTNSVAVHLYTECLGYK